jgi:hypothetical protein
VHEQIRKKKKLLEILFTPTWSPSVLVFNKWKSFLTYLKLNYENVTEIKINYSLAPVEHN